MLHFVSKSSVGEACRVCSAPATHKLGEEIPPDDPWQNRHNFTAYVCCGCFKMVLGPRVSCPGSQTIRS